ncbi:MAG: M48 family metallopeptidase, partial [Pseudomonadota bacterium]
MTVTVEADALSVRSSGTLPPLATWPLPDVRALPSETSRSRLTLSQCIDDAVDGVALAEARLILDDPDAIALVRAICPALDRRDLAAGTARRVVWRLSLAAVALAVMLFVILPAIAGTLARLIPPEREAQWGRSVVAQIERFFGAEALGSLVCRDPAGQQALQAMIARLRAGTEVSYDLNVQVFDHGMINAFAAPGGQIVIMRGLIDAAEGPDEVAAVLAHEIAHVEHRDATRNTLRAAGSAGLLAMVVGDFAGGSVAVVMADAVLNSSYSRKAEARADAYAHTMLEAAGISAAGMSAFFDRLSGIDGAFEIPEFLASHPETAARGRAAQEFAQVQKDT